MSLVILAIGLTATIVAALAYARWQVRHIARDLPARLGIQIQQSTEGFTYSKTEQGRTVFTLHAARALQYRAGGHAVLHDVRIQVFHPQDGLADIITGNEFEYDPNNGIVRALDEAHIDLHAPVEASPSSPAEKSSGTAKTSGTQAAAPDRLIHVVTRGLVFNQKTGVATTDELLEFRLPQGSGHAVGAVYDSDQGQLLLKSKVVIHTQTQNGPAVIHATQSTYDQHVSQVYMENATYVTAMEHASSRAVTILLRPDSSVENINAQRDVHYRTTRGESVSAQSMVAALDDHSRPQAAHFSGDVRFHWQQPQESTRGSAAEGQFFFNHRGHLRQAILDRAVHLRQRMLALPSPMERNVRANHLVMDFVEDAAGNAELRHAVATGDAWVHQRAISTPQTARKPVPGSAQPNTVQDTTIRARQLIAQFSAGNQLQRMDGKGNTQLRSVAANGDVDTSSGDTLQVMFAASPPAPKKKSQQKKEAAGAALVVNANTIQTAVQQGHVMLQQVAATHPTPLARQPNMQASVHPEISTATADRAEYHGEMQQLMLTGNPHFEDSDTEMVAQQMQVNRATGEMTATGAVQTTIRGGATAGGLLGGSEATSGSQEATYIIADQAVLHRNTQQAIFTGHARLWQGANVIEAPVIEILQGQQSLQAYGESQSSEIRCTFVASSATGAHIQNAPTPISVTSKRLLYSDAERKAHFTGQVTVTMQGDRLQSDVADLYLQSSIPAMPAVPAAPAHPTKNNLQSRHNDSMQSSVERMVVQGNVRFAQPGRYGTGARIVYTASDGRFVLTGSEQAPPMIVDAAQGSLTGHVLIFESQQNTIQVQGGNAATTTKTRVQK